ncbi:MAG: LCP family protein [Chloroflexi bacterium]|nr:LCP family protein [Chloroflexota bacterium]
MTVIAGSTKRKKGWRNRLKLVVLLLLLVSALAGGGGVAFSLMYQPEWPIEIIEIVEVVQRLSPELPVSVLPKRENVPDWRNEERVNILLLGVDRRPNEVNAPTRTDTILIATIDPGSKSAGLLGVPRDLWVDIPYKEGSIIQDRVNTAYFYGDFYKYPGGGPALAMETIRRNLGVKTHYYASIEFEGFENIIDTLGGVTIDMKEPLIDPHYPTRDFGTMSIYIPAGVQHLDGEKALWYARSRFQWADFGRMKHQQELLMAIRDRAMQLGIIPKLPALIGDLGGTVKTDLSVSEILTLATIAREIDPESIMSRSLDMKYLTATLTTAGADVVVPDRQKVKELINEMFFDPKLRKEDASILVLNGTSKTGLAGRVASHLQGRGLTQVTTGNADALSYKETIIYDYSAKRYTANYLAEMLGVPASQVKAKNDPARQADVTVILGDDAKVPKN